MDPKSELGTGPDSDLASHADAEADNDHDSPPEQKLFASNNEEHEQELNRTRIKEVKQEEETSTSKMVPREPDISRRMDATAIFPEEVWRMILGKLTDPHDLWRCYNTCELFADILSEWGAGYIMEVALPHLYRHLPGNRLLECRLVCKGWNKKIANFLEDHPSIRPYDNKRDPRKLEYVNLVLEKGLNERNVYNFWNPDCNPDLQLTFNGNPFPGRHVTLMMRRDYPRLGRGNAWGEHEGMLNSVYEKIYTFLQLYGKEIFYLNFCDGGSRAWDKRRILGFTMRGQNDVTPQKLKYRQLVTVDVFHLVPNLRKLGFGGMEYEVQENVNIHPELLPLPPILDSLEAYEIYGSANWNKPDPIAHALMLRFRPQLKMLHARSTDWKMELFGLEWPLLTELNIRVTDYDYWSVENFGLGMPSLRKLGLDVHGSGSGWGLMGIETLMKGFDRLSSVTKLDTLRLAGLDEKQLWQFVPGPDISYWIAPSTLETLELEFDNSLGVGPKACHVLLLLRRFPNIKNLHIFSRTRSLKYQSEVHLSTECKWIGWDSSDLTRPLVNEKRPEIDEVHKFLGYEASGGERGDMYRSNIWELLPRLNVFTFQWDVYTRDGYEKYSRKKNF